MEPTVFPTVISIETSSACNARCVMCIPRELIKRPALMSGELFKLIVGQLPGNKVGIVCLAHFGEPLLDPAIAERVAYIYEVLPKSGLNYTIALWTNGQLLTRELSRALLQAHLTSMNISIDSIHKEVFETNRRGLHFETVVTNAEVFLAERRGGGYPCVVRIHRTITPLTAKEDFPAFKEYWLMREADFVDHLEAESGANLSPKMTLDHGKPKEPCAAPFNTFTVLTDGRAVLCCKDALGAVLLGNVREQSIEEIWYSAVYEHLRVLHNNGRKSEIPLCAECGAVR